MVLFFATEILCRDRARVTACTVLAAVHTTDLRQCTVLCTIWVTVHGHCSRTLFMGIVKKQKMTLRDWGVTL